jgi:TetR/AcrR family transcriptional repressor of mexJK operon
MEDHESVMSIHPKRRGPGRPRDPAKLEAILDAAYALFLERGITATTMDAVAERASVSKMTVYANFRDKPALVSAGFDRMIKLMHVFDLAVGPDLNSSVERLVELGKPVASVASQPEVIRMVRLMTECADEHPRMAAAFYTAGRGELLKQVAAFLRL